MWGGEIVYKYAAGRNYFYVLQAYMALACGCTLNHTQIIMSGSLKG